MNLYVEQAGVLTTVQDHGRAGFAHLGVPRAGALDRPAADLANRLVGNEPTDALLEVTLGGLILVAGRALTVALTGAPAPLTTGGRAQAFAEPVSVRAGDRIVVGAPATGVRSYLAVAGGIDCPAVLGSRSTDTLVGLGPPVVAAGTTLPVGRPRREPPHLDAAVPTVLGRRVRLLPGPRADWFAADAVEVLTRSPYTVTADSNRVGLRLDGASLRRQRDGELPSEGIVLGAIQVPPSGQPVVFLADHPVTGGYPVIAVVHTDDLPICAQARPGDRLEFVAMPGTG